MNVDGYASIRVPDLLICDNADIVASIRAQITAKPPEVRMYCSLMFYCPGLIFKAHTLSCNHIES